MLAHLRFFTSFLKLGFYYSLCCSNRICGYDIHLLSVRKSTETRQFWKKSFICQTLPSLVKTWPDVKWTQILNDNVWCLWTIPGLWFWLPRLVIKNICRIFCCWFLTLTPRFTIFWVKLCSFSTQLFTNSQYNFYECKSKLVAVALVLLVIINPNYITRLCHQPVWYINLPKQLYSWIGAFLCLWIITIIL